MFTCKFEKGAEVGYDPVTDWMRRLRAGVGPTQCDDLDPSGENPNNRVGLPSGGNSSSGVGLTVASK